MVLAASSVRAVIAGGRGEKASLAGEPPSMYKQQTESYSISTSVLFYSSTFEIYNLTVSHPYQFHWIYYDYRK